MTCIRYRIPFTLYSPKGYVAVRYCNVSLNLFWEQKTEYAFYNRPPGLEIVLPRRNLVPVWVTTTLNACCVPQKPALASILTVPRCYQIVYGCILHNIYWRIDSVTLMGTTEGIPHKAPRTRFVTSLHSANLTHQCTIGYSVRQQNAGTRGTDMRRELLYFELILCRTITPSKLKSPARLTNTLFSNTYRTALCGSGHLHWQTSLVSARIGLLAS